MVPIILCQSTWPPRYFRPDHRDTKQTDAQPDFPVLISNRRFDLYSLLFAIKTAMNHRDRRRNRLERELGGASLARENARPLLYFLFLNE